MRSGRDILPVTSQVRCLWGLRHPLGLRLLLAMAAFAGWGACDTGEFSSLRRTMPVQALSVPGSFGAREFGRTVVPLPPLQNVSGRLFISGWDKPSLGIIHFNPAGDPQPFVATKEELASLGGYAVRSAALSPDGRTMLLGAYDWETAIRASAASAVYALDLGPQNGRYTFDAVPVGVGSTESDDIGTGKAVAWAVGFGDPSIPDAIAVSDKTVSVFVDYPQIEPLTGKVRAPITYTGDERDLCSISITGLTRLSSNNSLTRSVAVGDLRGDGRETIAVGTPSVLDSGAGRVVFIQGSESNPDELVCAGYLTNDEADNRTPNFGVSIAGVDGDGQGTIDGLVVGAPPESGGQGMVFYYDREALVRHFDDDKSTSGSGLGIPSAFFTAPANAIGSNGAFGERVFAEDLDGQSGDEIVISDPNLNQPGATAAGGVFVYKKIPDSDDYAQFGRNFGDEFPEANQRFGVSVVAMPFRLGDCNNSVVFPIPVMAGPTEAFVIFRFPFGFSPEPRCF